MARRRRGCCSAAAGANVGGSEAGSRSGALGVESVVQLAELLLGCGVGRKHGDLAPRGAGGARLLGADEARLGEGPLLALQGHGPGFGAAYIVLVVVEALPGVSGELERVEDVGVEELSGGRRSEIGHF